LHEMKKVRLLTLNRAPNTYKASDVKREK
jgi:hypothetical protein